MRAYSSYTDAALIARLRSCDQVAYAEIYKRYWAVLFRHARKMLQNEEEARDVIQDVFAALWTKAPELVIKTSLPAYLYSAVRNKILNLIDHNRVKTDYLESLDKFMDQGARVTDQMVRERELAAIIEQEVAMLPARMREVFELSRKDGLSYKEIAAKLDIADNTVKKQVHKAISILRLKLSSLISLLLFLVP